MKRVEPLSVGEIIDRVFSEDGNREEVMARRASYVWADVVGPGITRYTSRRYVRAGVLHVYITSASLKNELSFHRQSLIEQINKSVGENVIKAIEIH